MVIDISSNSSTSSVSFPIADELIREALRIQVISRTLIDYKEPFDSSSTLRLATAFDPLEMETSSTSDHGPGPFVNSPEEVQRRRMTVRSCPYQNQFFSGALVAYEEFTRIHSIPPDVQVWLLPITDPHQLLHRPGELIFPLMAIIEGGIRLPLHHFVRRMLQKLTLTSS